MSAAEVAARLGLYRAGHTFRGECPCCHYPTGLVLADGRGGRLKAWCVNGCGERPTPTASDPHPVSPLWVELCDLGGGVKAYMPSSGAGASSADKVAEQARKTARALGSWNGAEPVPGMPAEQYLKSRRIEHIASSPALRWRADVPHPSGRGRLPALLCRIDGPDGNFRALQRIYLKRDGSGKAEIEPAKASLGPVAGGAVRLDAAAAELVVAEGVETTAAAGRLLGLPAWAAVSCGNLARSMVLPPDVRSVVIAVDRDPPGERAAREAAWRWKREGRRVRLMVPDREGQDANDVLRERADA
ncbi:MAG: DUF7146 domain-containing protein [Acetobacteraceae bacterium]